MAATFALPSSIAAESGRRARLRLWPEWLTLFLYTSILAFAIPFHEPWADEAQAWQMAGHTSLLHLFTTSLRYEGHPALWYLLLKALQHCGAGYTGMQWFAGLCATIAAGLLIFRAPFPRIARLTLPFTFFLAYQYAIVARSYVLIPLLLFLTAIAWKQNNALKIALWLGLLSNVELHATAVGVGLAILYYVESRNGRRKVDHRTAAIVIFLGLFVLAVLTVLPQPKDLLVNTPLQDSPLATGIVLWIIMSGIFPSLGLILSHWYTGLLPFGVLIWALRGSVPSRYLLPLIFLAAFGGYYTAFWHLGIPLVTCIAIAWIAWPLHFRTKSAQEIARFTTLAVIALQIVYTATAVVEDHYLAYSGDLAAAQYLSPMVKARVPMALTYVKNTGFGSYYSVGLRPYLPGPIFINEPAEFWRWSNTAHPRAAFENALKQHPPIVVVEYYDPKSRPFQPQREYYSRSISHLDELGYVHTRTFCGYRPQGLYLKSDVCHLVFEMPSQSSSPAPKK